jgi:hypothetical protein
MLYQQKQLGQSWIGARFAARLAIMLTGKRYADVDLLAMNAHLRRDLGLHETGGGFMPGEIWRK